MNTPPPCTRPPDEAAPRAAERARHRAILNELIELGADAARMVHRQIKVTHDYEVETGTTVWPAPDRTASFERMARSVRRTILLIERLDEPARAPTSDDRRAVQDRAWRGVEAASACALVDDELEDAPADAAERLDAERPERVDTLDSEDWLDARPMAELIAGICRELGLVAKQAGYRPARQWNSAPRPVPPAPEADPGDARLLSHIWPAARAPRRTTPIGTPMSEPGERERWPTGVPPPSR